MAVLAVTRTEARDVPPPPDDLAPDTFAARLYDMLEPLAQHDPEYQWSLLIFVNAAVQAYQLVEDMVRDTQDGVGWSPLMDVNRCPPEALGWLAQFVGTRLRSGDTDDSNRNRIVATDGWRRGTVAAMEGAVYPTLTGKKRLYLRERDHVSTDTPAYAYYLTAITYSSETPDPTATLNALLAQKPGGIVLTYLVQTGQMYSQVVSRYATYAALNAAYPSYAVMLADEP